MQIELVATGLGIITTLIGLGWKFGIYLADIKMSVAKIEAILTHTSARLDRIEIEVRDIDRRLHEHENKSKS